MSRTMKIVFTVSVIGNVLLAGIVGGMAMRHGEHRQRDFSDLNPKSAALVEKTFSEVRGRIRPLFDDLKEARERLSDTASREDMDEQAFEAALTDIHRIHGEMFAAKMQAMREIVDELPPEDRKAMTPYFMKPGGHFMRSRKCGAEERENLQKPPEKE